MVQNGTTMRVRFTPFLLMLVSASVLAQSGSYPVFEPQRYAPAETKARRERLKRDMGPGSIGVFFTNPERNRNNDVGFLFRGDSNFLYLTGFEEPDAALILVPDGFVLDGRRVTEVLFLNTSNAMSETWLGYRMGPANAPRILGIEAAQNNAGFSDVLAAAAANAKKLTTDRVPTDAGNTMLGRMVRSFSEWRTAEQPTAGINGSRALARYRQIKSPWEIAQIRRAAAISAQAHVEAMRSIKPGMREYEIGSLVAYIFGREGCDYPGYPPICGSGPNSTILHYESNRRQMQAGEIFCMDAAGEYFGYSADITRSFPVSGRFSPAQRAIYDIVLAAEDRAISMCRVGTNMSAIDGAVQKVLADGLTKLGIIKSPNELGRYYMHGFGHGIGLDVHDSVPGVLAVGAVLTCEPGIYIKAGSPCDKKWWNIGIRIEDDILVTEKGPENLSVGAPRKAADIEKLMAETGMGNAPIRPWKG